MVPRLVGRLSMHAISASTTHTIVPPPPPTLFPSRSSQPALTGATQLAPVVPRGYSHDWLSWYHRRTSYEQYGVQLKLFGVGTIGMFVCDPFSAAVVVSTGATQLHRCKLQPRTATQPLHTLVNFAAGGNDDPTKSRDRSNGSNTPTGASSEADPPMCRQQVVASSPPRWRLHVPPTL